MKRVRTPRVIQMEAVECGAASLSIILRYYGRYVPLEILRVECGVSRNGSNALNMLKAAEKYGLRGKGAKISVEKLKDINYPAILFWGFNHFLVLEGFSKDQVYINDPDSGPRTISFEDLKDGYSGAVLLFEKTENFQKGGKPEPVLGQIWERLKIAPYPLLFALITGICLFLPGFAMPAFLMFFIDAYFVKDFLPWHNVFLSAVLLTALFTAGLNGLRGYAMNRLNTRLSLHYGSHFLWHLLKLPMAFYHQRFYGEIASRTMLNDTVIQSLTGSLLTAVIDLLLIVFYGAVMFTYDGLIALIGVLVGLANLWVMGLVFRARANTYACLQQDIGKTTGVAIGGLQFIESIKVKSSESDFFTQWSGHYARTINAYQEIGKKDIILLTVPVFFQLLAGIALLGLGSFRVMAGDLTVGMLMSLQLLMTNFLLPINRFVGFSQTIQTLKIDLNRLNDVLKNPVDVWYSPSSEPKGDQPQLTGHLEFKKVTFGYNLLDTPLIQDLSFVVEPGKRLAFVGKSGSGKSTIANLASGLLHPWSGEILYDGIPIQKISKEWLTNSIATVDQSIFLFKGSIRENLTLWNSRVPDEMLNAACRDALIHSEVIARPGGYDSLLIEGGRNLSGGQRQRLEIARALLYNPVFLILDEATSALDSKTEQEISLCLRQRGCSALMIAHRLSTIQDCDEIIVLEKGTVAQRGTHEQLKGVPGIYQELILNELPE